MTAGRALETAVVVPVVGELLVGDDVGLVVELDGQLTGRHVGGPWLVVCDDGGGADEVDWVVGGALDVGAEVLVGRVVGGGGGGGVWPGSGGFPVTYAGGGKFSTGRPAMSAFITAVQVAVG